jgi:hypothetical protein
VWIWQSLRHLIVGPSIGRERFLLRFRGADAMPFTYMLTQRNEVCFFQNPGDGTILAKRWDSDAPIEYVIVEEPQWGLVFALPRACFQPFASAVDTMEGIVRTGEIEGAETFAQDISCFPERYHHYGS